MKASYDVNIVELIQNNTIFKVSIDDGNVVLTNDNDTVIIVLSTNNEREIILKEFTIRMGDDKVIIQYTYDEEGRHFSTIAFDGIPTVGRLEYGNPIVFGIEGLIDFLRDVSAGAIPAPVAGFLFPPLMPS